MSDAVNEVANWVISRQKPAVEEPCFIDQTVLPGGLTADVVDWLNQCNFQAEQQGCVRSESTVRISVHRDDTDIKLYEAWKTTPKNMGEPRFKFDWQKP